MVDKVKRTGYVFGSMHFCSFGLLIVAAFDLPLRFKAHWLWLWFYALLSFWFVDCGSLRFESWESFVGEVPWPSKLDLDHVPHLQSFGPFLWRAVAERVETTSSLAEKKLYYCFNEVLCHCVYIVQRIKLACLKAFFRSKIPADSSAGIVASRIFGYLDPEYIRLKAEREPSSKHHVNMICHHISRSCELLRNKMDEFLILLCMGISYSQSSKRCEVSSLFFLADHFV